MNINSIYNTFIIIWIDKILQLWNNYVKLAPLKKSDIKVKNMPKMAFFDKIIKKQKYHVYNVKYHFLV